MLDLSCIVDARMDIPASNPMDIDVNACIFILQKFCARNKLIYNRLFENVDENDVGNETHNIPRLEVN